jgi:uncharacterized delta-60 repeat protein
MAPTSLRAAKGGPVVPVRIRKTTIGPFQRWLVPAVLAAVVATAAGGAAGAGGTLDPSFGVGGKVVTDLGVNSSDGASAAAVQADGKIVVAGTSDAKRKGADFALVRYTAGGKLDRSFGTGGKVLTDFGKVERLAAVTVQADGKIVVAGDTGEILSGSFIEGRFALARYTSSGKLDPTFGQGGKVVTEPGGNHDVAAAADIAQQSDGKIVVVGTAYYTDASRSYDDVAVVRYLNSGKLDLSFGTGGKVQTDMAKKGADEPSAVAVQPDGKIVVVGRTSHNGSAARAPLADFGIVRYLRSGKLDPSFGTGGKVITDLQTNSDDWPHALAMAAGGKLVVAGSTATKRPDGMVNLDSNFGVVRYTASGRLDAGFGTAGKIITDLGRKSGDGASGVAIQPDGKIVVVGASDATHQYDTEFALIRYTATGKLDTSFGTSGKVLTAFGAETSDYAAAVVIQKAGIVVVGNSQTQSNSDFALARYLK